jgi:putative tail protein
MGWWFGRILTFEVEAEDVSPTLGFILGNASAGAIECTATNVIGGYAAHGQSVRAAVQPLIDHFGIELFDDGSVVRSPSNASFLTVAEEELGCNAGTEAAARSEGAQVPARALPSTLTLSYYDRSRDFLTGQMRASIGTSGGVHEAVELPITSEAGAAKALAESSLARRWAQRDRRTLRLPPAHLAIEPGAVLQLPGETRRWIADRVTIDGLVAITELHPAWSAVDALPAGPGRPVPAPDIVASPTALALLDLPDLGLSRHDVPVLHLAATSSSPGWRAVPIEIATQGEIRSGQSAFNEAILGTALSVLGSGQAALLDLANSIEVELVDPDHWLESRDDASLVQGANIAALGSELIQFGSAIPIGPKRFRLERLLRGRRGTEWAMNTHTVGELFVLLNANSLRAIELTRESLGSAVEVRALGIGDGSGTALSTVTGGEAMRPPSPVHLRASIEGDGTLHASWVRRSRNGWAWTDDIDAPLGEAAERYRVRVDGPGGSLEAETAVPNVEFDAAQLAGIGPGAAISVVQVGDHALSRLTELQLILT